MHTYMYTRNLVRFRELALDRLGNESQIIGEELGMRV